MPFGHECHTSDAEFFPGQQIWRHTFASITGNVDFGHVVKKCLLGLSTVKLLFTFYILQIPYVEEFLANPTFGYSSEFHLLHLTSTDDSCLNKLLCWLSNDDILTLPFLLH